MTQLHINIAVYPTRSASERLSGETLQGEQIQLYIGPAYQGTRQSESILAQPGIRRDQKTERQESLARPRGGVDQGGNQPRAAKRKRVWRSCISKSH